MVLKIVLSIYRPIFIILKTNIVLGFQSLPRISYY
jgi:hypothetical protein